MNHLFTPAFAVIVAAVSFATYAPAAGSQSGPAGPTAAEEGKPADAGGVNIKMPKLPQGQLPWKRAGEAAEAVEPPKNAREVLAGYDIGDADLATIKDGRAADAAEQETILRILYRLPYFRRTSVARWAAKTVPWQQLAGQAAEHRVQFFHIQGRATRVVAVKLPDEKAEIYEMPSYWRVSVVCPGGPPVTLLSRDVPRAWLRAEQLDQPIAADALFLKVEPAGDQKPAESEKDGENAASGAAPLLFATERIAWHPDKVDPQLGVGADQVYLSGLGLDVAALSAVTDRSSSLPREAFYQLLTAVGSADRAKLEKLSRPFNIVDLLKKSDAERGRVISITGHAQQVTKILVDEPDVREQYGIDHYYEIDMFVPLETPVLLEDPNDKSKALSYRTYPITVCVRELPEGLAAPGKPNVYQAVNRDVTLPAVFFKVWAVSTARARELGADRKQFNPLLIGATPQVVEYEPLSSPVLGVAVGAAFAVVLLALWLGIWRSQKKDKRFERENVRRQFEVEPGKSLDDVGIEARDGPDFSGLEEDKDEG